MPWKVVGKCVHKLNTDGSVGEIVPGGCHKTVGEAQSHKRALYSNVKEKPMSKASRVKEKQRRERRRQVEFQKQEELPEDEELTEEEELELLHRPAEGPRQGTGGASAGEEPKLEQMEKGYDDYAEASEMAMNYGPTTFEELDDMRAAEHKAHVIAATSWDVQDLVRNIIHSPMLQGTEKANAIKKVGNDFGERVQSIMDTPAQMLKEKDPEVLEIEAVLAHDERHMSILEKTVGIFQKKDLSAAARNKLEDSSFALPEKRKYPIHDKAHVRNALARAAQQLKAGGDGAMDAKKALPKIRAAAKRMGIETSMEKDRTGIIIQKDAQGDWRWIGWPSNNFIDHSTDILTEGAHREYVDWWHKEKPNFPIYTSLHAPGTVRTNPADFVGYENGFLVMSGKLTEPEAVALLEVQKEYDLGMSHTGWGVRSKEDPRQIVMYRIFEVTDLPVEMADNPFTDLSVISKEADMKQEEQLAYLSKLLGDEERAKEALSLKTSMKQKELQEAGVEQKEKLHPAEDVLVEETPVTPAPAFDVAEIVKQVGEQYDIEGLNAAFTKMNAELEKLPILEKLVKQQADTIHKLSGDKEDALVEMISPPAGRFAWSQKQRASQSEETVIGGEEKEKLEKKKAGIPDSDDYWLAQETGIAPIPSEV